jgi:hypothetical protein
MRNGSDVNFEIQKVINTVKPFECLENGYKDGLIPNVGKNVFTSTQ